MITIKQQTQLLDAAEICINIFTQPVVRITKTKIEFEYQLSDCTHSNWADSTSLEALRRRVNAAIDSRCGTFWIGTRDGHIIFWATL